MSNFDVRAAAGERIVLPFGPVERNGLPVNLRAAGIKLRFIAKRSADDTDADAVTNLAYEFGVTENQGIVVTDTADDNTGYITIPEADTADFDRTELLLAELWLQEGNGRPTRIDRGVVKVGRAVLRGAV